MRPRVLREAEEELIEATLYYEDHCEGIGEDFFQRATDTILNIGKDPERFPVYEGKRLKRRYRRASVSRFPYVVVYQLRKEETLVVAVAHTSRQPGYWDARRDR